MEVLVYMLVCRYSMTQHSLGGLWGCGLINAKGEPAFIK